MFSCGDLHSYLNPALCGGALHPPLAALADSAKVLVVTATVQTACCHGGPSSGDCTTAMQKSILPCACIFKVSTTELVVHFLIRLGAHWFVS